MPKAVNTNSLIFGRLIRIKYRHAVKRAENFFAMLLLDDFAQSRRLADPVAQIVQLRSSHSAVADDVDVVDLGGMKGERPLHADAEGKTSDGEGLSDAAVSERDDDALKRLQSLSVAFFDLDPNLDGVADGQLGKIGAHRFFFDDVDDKKRGG